MKNLKFRNALETKLIKGELSAEKYWKFREILDKKYNIEKEIEMNKNKYTMDGFFQRVPEGLFGADQKWSVLIESTTSTWYYDEYQVDVEITWVKNPSNDLPENLENHYNYIFQREEGEDLTREIYRIYYNGRSFKISHYGDSGQMVVAPFDSILILKEWIVRNYNKFLASSFASKENTPIEMMRDN